MTRFVIALLILNEVRGVVMVAGLLKAYFSW
jgi:hypothetical protein